MTVPQQSALYENEQAEKEAEMLEQLVIRLGKDKLEELDENERRILKLFI